MRSYPSCWSKTLTSLGFRRVLRRQTKKPQLQRHFLYEMLEERRVMSTTPWSEGPSAYVSTMSTGDQFEPVLLETAFHVVGGKSAALFSVATVKNSAGEPTAIVSLREDAIADGELLHQLQLELRVGPTILAQYDVSVVLASDRSLATYRSDRLTEALASVEGRHSISLSEIAAKIDAEGGFTDLISRNSKDRLAISAERLVSLANVAQSEFTDVQRKKVYSAIQATSELIDLSVDELAPSNDFELVGPIRSDRTKVVQLSGSEAATLQKQLGSTAVLLAEQLRDDLSSSDVQLRAQAEAVRDALVAASPFSAVLWNGLQVNSKVQRSVKGGPGVVKYSAIYESGQLQLNDRIIVDAGRESVIEVVERSSQARGFAVAALGAEAGPASVEAVADTTIMNPDLTGGTASTNNYVTVVNGVFDSTPLQSDAIFKFDVSGYSQYVNEAHVTLRPSTIVGSGLVHQADLMASDSWAETATWSTPNIRSAAEPLKTVNGSSSWTVTNSLLPVELDVTRQVRQRLRQGDMNFDFTRQDLGVHDDVIAFEMAVKNSAMFAQTYATFISDATDVLDRGDLNRDGVINAADAAAFLAVHGYIQGDHNFDGEVDGMGFLEWQRNLGSTKSYVNGDADFSGVIDHGDLAVWANNWGLSAPAPPEDVISVRVYAPTQTPGSAPYVNYSSREALIDRPTITAEQPVDVVATKFGAAANGQLQVTYSVLNEAVDGVAIKIYRSVDGTSLTEELMTYQVPSGSTLEPGLSKLVSFDADFDGGVLSENDRLIAVVETSTGIGQAAVANQSLSFTGGAFREGDVIYLLGSAKDDTFFVTKGSLDFTVSGDHSATIPSSGVTSIRGLLYGGNDRLVAQSSVNIPITAWGGDGSDILYGGTNNDTLYGGAGNDILIGGGGLSDSYNWGNAGNVKDAIVVTTLADENGATSGTRYNNGFTVGSLSLREALVVAADSGGADTISFAPTVVGNINIASGLSVNSDVSIKGPGATKLTIDANESGRVISVSGTGVIQVTISGLTIAGGKITGDGAGIYNASENLTLQNVVVTDNEAVQAGNNALGGGLFSSGGTVTVIDSTFQGNAAARGGGIRTQSGVTLSISGSTFFDNHTTGAEGALSTHETTATIVNSTFSGNSAPTGGAIRTNATGAMTIVNSTIVNNTTSGAGGGIQVTGAGTVTLHNTILAGNTSVSTAQDDLSGPIAISSSYNIFTQTTGVPTANGNQTGVSLATILVDDPDLAGFQPLLAYNGGRTRSHALAPTSPAIDAGKSVGAPSVDQRGATRPVDDPNKLDVVSAYDIGAYEKPAFDLDSTSSGVTSTVAWVADEGPVDIVPEATIGGFGSQVTTIRVTIEDFELGDGDSLAASPANSAITWSFTAGALVLVGSASESDFQEALRSVTYDNSDYPGAIDRTISIGLFNRTVLLGSGTATVIPLVRGTIDLYPIEDIANKNLYGNSGAGNDGQSSRMPAGTAGDVSSYIKFVLPSQLSPSSDAQIDEALLRLYGSNFLDSGTAGQATPSSQILDIYSHSNSWSELDPNKPTLPIGSGLTPIDSFVITSGGYGYADLTSAIAGAATEEVSFAVSDADTSDSIWTLLGTSESTIASQRPVLSVSGLFRNSRPVATNETYDFQFATYLRVSASDGVLKNATDEDEGAYLTAELVSGPNLGEIVFKEDGSFSYYPGPHAIFEDSFKYRVYDGIQYSEPRTVHLESLSSNRLEFSPEYSWVIRDNSADPVDVPFNLTNPGDWIYKSYDSSSEESSEEEEGPSPSPGKDHVVVPAHRSYFVFDLAAAFSELADPTNEIVSARLEWTTPFSGDPPSYLMYAPYDLFPTMGNSGGHTVWNSTYSNATNADVNIATYVEMMSSSELEDALDRPNIRDLDGGYEQYGGQSLLHDDYWRTSLTDRLLYYPNTRDVTADVKQLLALDKSFLEVGFEGKNFNSTVIGDVRLYVSYAETPNPPAPHPQDPASPNQAPYFVKSAQNRAAVGSPYAYQLAASDWENDELFLAVPTIEWPDGYVPESGDLPTLVQDVDSLGRRLPTATMTWNPPAKLIGKTVRFTETVRDSFNLPVLRTFDVLVTSDPTRHAPVILNDPSLVHDFAPGGESIGEVLPEKVTVNINYADSAGNRNEELLEVSVTRRGIPVFGGGSFTPPSGEAGKLSVTNVAVTPEGIDDAATELVNALTSGGNAGIQVTGVNFAAVPWSQVTSVPNSDQSQIVSTTGIFVNDSSTYGLGPLGIVLSTGNAGSYGSGPNTKPNFGTPLDSAAVPAGEIDDLLKSITGSEGHYDATMLQVQFLAESGTSEIAFDIVFGSEEFSSYVGQFIDGFGLFIEELSNVGGVWTPVEGTRKNLATVEAFAPPLDHPIRFAYPDLFTVGGQSIPPGERFDQPWWMNIDHPQMTPRGELEEGTELNAVLVPDPRSPSFVEEGSAVNRFTAKGIVAGKQYRLSFLLADTRDSVLDTTVFISNLGGVAADEATIDLEAVLPDGDEALIADLFEKITSAIEQVRPGQTATFEIKLKSDGKPHNLDLKFWETDALGNKALLGSTPVSLNTDYRWTPVTFDQDIGDTLTYELIESPEGVEFNPATGSIRWTPTGEGPAKFHLIVRDSFGLEDERIWTVNVQADHSNSAPAFAVNDLGTLEAQVGRLFQPPKVGAKDSNPGDVLEYYFEAGTAPAGMTIGLHTGQISWEPTSGQQGTLANPVRVLVFDRRGGSDAYQFNVNVSPREIYVNAPPKIEFFPGQVDKPNLVTTVEGSRLRIPVRISDPQNHKVSLAVEGPAGVFFDAEGGFLVWRPQGDVTVGDHTIVLRGDDGHGAQTAESIRVRVLSSNIRPEFADSPELAYAGLDQTFAYPLLATDANGDPLTFTPLQMPPGMEITYDDGQPQLTWPDMITGNHRVLVEVSDGRGGFDVLDLSLRVDVHAPPTIEGTPKTITPTGKDYEFQFSLLSTGEFSDLDALVGTPGMLSASLGQLRLNPEAIAAGVEIYYSGAAASGSPGNLVYGGLIVKWTPDYAGQLPITITATNDYGAQLTTSFTLTVADAVNVTDPPKFALMPQGPAVANALSPWTFSLAGIDPDGDDEELIFEVLEPSTATIVGDEVRWSPTAVGEGKFRIKLTDESGSWSILSFMLPVVASPQPQIEIPATHFIPAKNEGPTFAAKTLGPFYKGQAVELQLAAQDKNGHEISGYSLDSLNSTVPGLLPGNLSTGGLLAWTPTASGEYVISLSVADEFGAVTTVPFSIVILDNAAPKIEAFAVEKIDISEAFTHDFTITDPNEFDDVTVLPLNAEALAAGLTLARIGSSNVWRLSWPTPVVGRVPLSIAAVDGHGAKRIFQTTLVAYDAEESPQSSVGPIHVPAERQFQLNLAEGADAGFVFSWSTANGYTPPAGVKLTSEGRITWTPVFGMINSTPYSLQLVATNAALQSANVTVQVRVWDYDDLAMTAPSVTSTAPRQATAGETLFYDLSVENLGGRPTRWEWVSRPAGMEVVNNQIRWTPPAEMIGKKAPIALRIVDASGFGAIHQFELEIVATNQKPELKTTIPPIWRLNEAESVTIVAIDPEGHEVNVELKAMPGGSPVPAGMTIVQDSDGISLDWTPASPGHQVNRSYTFIIRVEEKHRPESFTEKLVTVTVRAADYNRVPSIDLTPDNLYASIADGYENTFQIIASDLDAGNGGFIYEIIAGQSGNMYLHPTTGVLTWSPVANETLDERGERAITVKVTDDPLVGEPQSITRTFVLNAIKNAPPSLLNELEDFVQVGGKLRLGVKAKDDAPSTLRYRIDPSYADAADLIASGLSINEVTGVLQWNVPPTAATGQKLVRVQAIDQFNAVAETEVTINIENDASGPAIRIRIIDQNTGEVVKSGGQLIIDGDYIVIVELRDGAASGGFDGQLAWKIGDVVTPYSTPLEERRTTFEFAPTEYGVFSFIVTAEDSTGKESSQEVKFSVVDEISDAKAVISSPIAGGVVTEPSEITGSVTLTSGQSYVLELVDDARGVTRTIATGSSVGVSNGSLGNLDPTLVEDGAYRLVLKIVSGASIFAYAEQRIEIKNALKIGDLRMSFADLTVDLGGIPIALTRLYDSKAAGIVGEFGYGWKLGLTSTRATFSHPERAITNINDSLPLGTRIVVTLPDGSQQGFTFTESGGSPYFVPDEGVTTNLSFGNVFNFRSLTASPLYPGELWDGHPDADRFMPWDYADDLVLTSRDGLIYHFDFMDGRLTSISDRGDRSVTIGKVDPLTNKQEITSSGGSQKITLQRNTLGLITKITDPNGNSIDYHYGTYTSPALDEDDAVKQLAKITDRAGVVTYYSYDEITPSTGFVYALVGSYDGAHVRTLTAGYNSVGRLNQLQDSGGASTQVLYTLDLGDGRSVETIRNDENNFIELVRDERGNVLLTIVPLDDPGDEVEPAERRYLITESVYDEYSNLLLRQSNPFTVVGADNRFGAHADSPDETPTAWAQRLSYDTANRVEFSRDALGAITSYKYDDEDRVVAVIAPDGAVTHTVYDPNTGDLRETYLTKGNNAAKFNHTLFEYDLGRLVRTYQVSGADRQLVSESHYFTAGDNYGRLEWTEDAAGLRRYFGYDANGNQTLTVHLWTNGVTSETIVSRTDYDGEGRAVKTYQYDRTGNYVVDALAANASAYASGTPIASLDSSLSGYLLRSTSEARLDAQGRVEWTQDRFGAKTYSAYNSRGQVIETRSDAKDADGHAGYLITRTLYDSQGRVEFASDSYFMKAADYVTYSGVKASLGIRTVYDALGRAVRSERYAGVSLAIGTDGNGLPITTTSFAFRNDGVGTVPISASSTHYDDLGRVEFVVNESGARTDYYYDAAGRQIATLGPVVTIGGVPQRHLTETAYDITGRVVQSRSNIAVMAWLNDHPNGITGSAANLHPEDLPQGGPEAAVGRTKMQTTFYEYDAAGRQIAVISSRLSDPNGDQDTSDAYHIRTETEYDAFGRRVASRQGIIQADPFNSSTILRDEERATSYEYDAAGNLSAVNLPMITSVTYQGGSDSNIRPRYEYQYDMYGNRIAVTTNAYVKSDGVTVVYLRKDALTGQDAFAYSRSLGSELSLSHNAVTTTTTFTFDQRDRQTSRTLPLGVGSTGFVERAIFADGSATTLGSVGNGQLEYTVDFEGRVTAYRYDNTSRGGGRLVEKRFFDNEGLYLAAPNSPAEKVVYVYDEFGREREVKSYQGVTLTRTVVNGYDAEGRLTSVAAPEGTINYVYDPATGNQTRVYTDETDTTYVYDDLGRLDQVILTKREGVTPIGGNEETVYFYDRVGRLDYERLPGGVTRDSIYDELGRTTRIDSFIDEDDDGVWDIGERRIAAFDYLYDANNQQRSLREEFNLDNAGGVDAVHRYRWSYDALGRLIEESFDDGDDGPSAKDYVDRFSFDVTGNRLEKQRDAGNGVPASFSADETTVYGYDANDRLHWETKDVVTGGTTDDTNTAYEYGPSDAQTAQTRETVRQGSTTLGQGAQVKQQSFVYDRQGRLQQATTVENAQTVVTQYEYDARGVRISRSVDGVKTLFVVDGRNPTGYAQTLEDRNATTGEVTKTYTLGLDVVTQAAGAAIYDLLYDVHGSTRVALDFTNAAQFYAYDAYGQLLDLSAFTASLQTAITSLLYSGEFRDNATGWDYLRARDYNSRTGRFGTLDPFEGLLNDPQSLNAYLYAYSNPISRIDPGGDFPPLLIAILAGAAIGAADAGLGGGTWGDIGWGAVQGAATGLVLGGILGGVGTLYKAGRIGATVFNGVQYGFAGTGFAAGGLGAYVSYVDGNYGQAGFRGAASLASVFALRYSLIRQLAGVKPRGTLSSVLRGHDEQQGFSGVYDLDTGAMTIAPSRNGNNLPEGWVLMNGGHATLSKWLGGNPESHRGFAAILQKDGSLLMRWRSGQLNKTTPNNLVEPVYRSRIVRDLQDATERTVISDE